MAPKLILRGLDAKKARVLHVFEPGDKIEIGRNRNCAVALPGDERVSRRHSRFLIEAEQWWIEDLESANGTWLNGQRVRRSSVQPGDSLIIGESLFTIDFEDPSFASMPSKRSVDPSDVSTTEFMLPEDLESDENPNPTAPMPIQAPSKDDSLPLIAERYERRELIHPGSSGRFYRAIDHKFDRVVCLKILAENLVTDEEQYARFIRGIQEASKLRHPNIVRLHRAGHTDGLYWIAMEYIAGMSVRQLVARFGVAKMLAPPRVLAIAQDIVAALEVAFEHNVVHRNIRPENILVDKKGRAKLSDFSLARGVVLDTLQQITKSAPMVVNIAYTAPELMEADGSPTCQTDIYSLGACLYALLTGRAPFESSSTIELIQKIRREEVPAPSRFNRSVPGSLEGVVLRMLAKSPLDRFQSPMELREELARVVRLSGA